MKVSVIIGFAIAFLLFIPVYDWVAGFYDTESYWVILPVLGVFAMNIGAAFLFSKLVSKYIDK